MTCSVSTEYTRRSIDVVLMENDTLRVEILAGKGADITKIVDKRTDTNVLFEAPHDWQAPAEGNAIGPDKKFSFLDYYPGGWQSVLPAAGGPADPHGASYGLHSESPLIPWDATVVTDTEPEVAVELSTSLVRYPFRITRTVALEAGDPTLYVSATVSNEGEVSARYSWLQHLAFGQSLVGPEASLDVPCEKVIVDPDHDHLNARFTPGESFEWPRCETDNGPVDLRTFPPKEARVHDLVALTDLSDGRYEITNPELGLGVTVRFPEDLFEYVWYWQAFGGYESAPFFGRNYTAGLEPCTSIPNAGLERAIQNGTANELAPAETVTADLAVELTHPA